MSDIHHYLPAPLAASVSAAIAGETPYIPTEEALKFIAFVRAGGLEENISPEAHYKIADVLFSSEHSDWKVVIECLRGMGKSTLLEYVYMYVSAQGRWPGFGEASFWVFLGANQEGNVKMFFKNVASKVNNSAFYSSVLEVQRQTDTDIELKNQAGFVTSVAGRGMNTNWRGIRSSDGKRPSVLLADDVLPNDVMTSEVIRKTIETNWYNSALPALNPIKHKIVYIGTPLSEADLLHKLKNSGVYKVIRFPLCSKFPCSEEEYDSVWPDRYSYRYARDMYKQYEASGTTQSFYTEYMLQVTDLATLLVDEEDIRWYDPSVMIKNRSAYNFYITTDFATSTNKSADYSVISVWAIGATDDWLLADGQCKRQTMQENLEDLFKYVRKWRPLSVGIESSGQQGGFLSIIDEMMITTGTFFTLARKRGSKEPGIRPVKDKMHRFVTGVQPKFKQRKVWIPKPDLLTARPDFLDHVTELLTELSKLTLAGGVKALKHDDAIDTLSMLSEMETFGGSGEIIPDNPAVAADNALWDDMFGEGEDETLGSTVF